MSNLSIQSGLKEEGNWDVVKSYIVPPLAAGFSIIWVIRDFAAKSQMQVGKNPSFMTFREGMKEGIKIAPTTGLLVGSQMVIQQAVEKHFFAGGKEKGIGSALASSGVVGLISSPIVAVFNGQAMGKTPLESMRGFSKKQGAVIAIQETAFVAGMSVSERVAQRIKAKVGESKLVDYGSAFTAGALGSLAGHPANTALTRWQGGLSVSPHQLMWGSLRKARAVGAFAVIYQWAKGVF